MLRKAVAPTRCDRFLFPVEISMSRKPPFLKKGLFLKKTFAEKKRNRVFHRIFIMIEAK